MSRRRGSVSSCSSEHGDGLGCFSDSQVGLGSRSLSHGGLAGVIDGCSVDTEHFAGWNRVRCGRLDRSEVGGTYCRITHIKHSVFQVHCHVYHINDILTCVFSHNPLYKQQIQPTSST